MARYIKAVAVQGKAQNLIEDEHTTSGTTWSSEKIKDEINSKVVGDFILKAYDVTFPTVTGNTYISLEGITDKRQNPVVLGTTSLYKTGAYYSNQFNDVLFHEQGGVVKLRFANVSQSQVDTFGGTPVRLYVAYTPLELI